VSARSVCGQRLCGSIAPPARRVEAARPIIGGRGSRSAEPEGGIHRRWRAPPHLFVRYLRRGNVSVSVVYHAVSQHQRTRGPSSDSAGSIDAWGACLRRSRCTPHRAGYGLHFLICSFVRWNGGSTVAVGARVCSASARSSGGTCLVKRCRLSGRIPRFSSRASHPATTRRRSRVTPGDDATSLTRHAPQIGNATRGAGAEPGQTRNQPSTLKPQLRHPIA
jgi:hypothetical protein